jgi:DNA-binding MarR family transcriptional regulator
MIIAPSLKYQVGLHYIRFPDTEKEGLVASSTERPGWLLKRAQDALNAAMTAALRDFGATLPEYAVLAALAEEPGLSNADLARRAFVTPQTMNQVLRELEQRGWVTRHPHPGHRRILQAELTADGRRTLAACHQAVDTVEGRMLAGLGPAERRQLAAGLRSCIDGLQRSVNQPRLVSPG